MSAVLPKLPFFFSYGELCRPQKYAEYWPKTSKTSPEGNYMLHRFGVQVILFYQAVVQTNDSSVFCTCRADADFFDRP